MTKVKVNDTELYYEEFGLGEPFLIMHGGLGIDHSYFRPMIDPLGDIFKLIFYDHRGEGRSGRPPINTITYEQLADDANALRDILGYDKIGVIGHSAGSCVALNYAIHHPKTISYLILMNAFPTFDYLNEMNEKVMQRNPSPEMIDALIAPVDSTIEGFKEQLIIIAPFYFYDYNSEMKEIIKNVYNKVILNPETADLSEKLNLKYNVCDSLPNIESPTLIIAGEDDIATPPSQARRIHDAIPNSKLVIFEKCGHYPFYEVPDEFFSAIRNWFNQFKL
jgi:proline iminopeptidase